MTGQPVSQQSVKRESALARRAWPLLTIGIVMVVIGMVISQSLGGIIVGVFNLAAVVLVLLGLVGLGIKLFQR